MPNANFSLTEFAAKLPPAGRLLGFDHGETTIGIALSDSTRLIASPERTIARRNWAADAAELRAMIAQHAPVGFVVGYPVHMDGSPGPRAQSVRAFARNLVALTDPPLPLLLWDERLSTAAVTRMMIDEMDINRKRRGELVDKLAASYLLQGALDGLRQSGMH